MKLSEAIRLGSMLRPQTRGALYARGGTCAIGAALEATGDDAFSLARAEQTGDESQIVARFGRYDILIPETCPVCCSREHCDAGDGLMTITHLNDDHRWTREQIADWVQTIEDAACDSSGEAQEQAVTTAVALCAPK